jgi:uncharacterized membrane protein
MKAEAAREQIESGAIEGGRARGANRWIDILLSLVSLVGLADAVYLTVSHLTGQSLRCTITTGCDEVLASPYSVVAGVPLAALGAAAYFTVFSLGVLALFGHAWTRPLLRVLVALMLACSLWLLYLQAYVIGSFCQYCLLSAAVTCALAALLVLQWLLRRR